MDVTGAAMVLMFLCRHCAPFLFHGVKLVGQNFKTSMQESQIERHVDVLIE